MTDESTASTAVMAGNGVTRRMGERWQIGLVEPWRSQPKVLLAAIRSRSLCDLDRDLPEALEQNRGFLVEAVRANPATWWTLPEPFDKDWTLVQEAIVDDATTSPATTKNDNVSIASHELACGIMERFPVLRDNKSFWSKLMESRVRDLPELIHMWAPPSLCADPEMMLRASICNVECLRYLDVSLFEERSFVESLLTEIEWEERLPLLFIPFETQLRWPDLVIRSFSKMKSKQSFEAGASWVAPDLWRDRSVTKAWFKAGGPFVDYLFPSSWKEDEELFLLLSQHCKSPRASFRLASPALKHSKTFMLQVVVYCPELLRYASHKLQRDFDVIVAALASTESNTDAILDFARNAFSVLARRNRGLDFIDSIDARVQQKLEAHATFTNVILPAMQDDTSTLSALDQVHETAKSYTRTIAAYLDAPEEKELPTLRKALEKLSVYYEEKRIRGPFQCVR